MNFCKKYFFFIFFSIYFFSNCFSTHSSSEKKTMDCNRVDTIDGYFLYEVNVPLKCFTRFDQIEQSNSLILFDSSNYRVYINKLYQQGIYIFNFSPVVVKFMEKNKTHLTQNRTSINKFLKEVSSFHHSNDSIYNQTLLYDQSGILSYKKIYCRFAIVSLGHLDNLVPNTVKYKCCFSNTKENISTYFIIDIFDFKLY